MNIPFVDLKAQYQSIKNEIDTAIKNVIDETAFISGKYASAFESAFAQAYGVKHCIGVANGTDAIYITLKMLGIGQGDEVITVANSWISTSETISQAGAKPVFIDIEKDYFNIDTSKIEEKITSKTKAIIPVHIYGQPAKIDEVKRICQKYNLFLIEDCAQSHFAEYQGQYVGTFGHAATFSFYPGKNLGAYGDAGAIITNDDELAQKMRMFANHGALKKHQHQIEGINSRLDGIQGAVLKVKLPYIHKWNNARFENGMLYNKLLSDLKQVETPKIREHCKPIFHVYELRVEKREQLIEYLTSQGIQTAIHYPVPLPFMPAYSYLNHTKSDFPVVAEQMNKILSLPMYPELSVEQIEYVTDTIKAFYK